MRLVKLTKTNNAGLIYIAPGAVSMVESQKDVTWISIGERTVVVQESIDVVMNALYYKNDGGHNFAESLAKKEATNG